MAKTKMGKDYFGLNYVVSLILAIIPITSWIFGFLTRFKEGHVFCGIFRLIFGWNVIWLIDLILMIFTHHILKIN